MHRLQIHSATPKAAAQQSMSIEPKPLDQQISEAYQSASQTETIARQLEARISQIDGAKHHLPARRYGQPVDLAQIKSNLTLSSLIAADSAELAHFIGLDPGIHHRIQEEKEARHLAAESLKLKTEQLAAKNKAAQEHRDYHFGRGLSPWSGRRLGT